MSLILEPASVVDARAGLQRDLRPQAPPPDTRPAIPLCVVIHAEYEYGDVADALNSAVAGLGLTGLNFQPSFFGRPIDDWTLYPISTTSRQILFATDWPALPTESALREWTELGGWEASMKRLLHGSVTDVLSGTVQ